MFKRFASHPPATAKDSNFASQEGNSSGFAPENISGFLNPGVAISAAVSSGSVTSCFSSSTELPVETEILLVGVSNSAKINYPTAVTTVVGSKGGEEGSLKVSPNKN